MNDAEAILEKQTKLAKYSHVHTKLSNLDQTGTASIVKNNIEHPMRTAYALTVRSCGQRVKSYTLRSVSKTVF